MDYIVPEMLEVINENQQDGELTKRLLEYNKKMSDLSARQQDRINFSRRLRRALRKTGISQKSLSNTLGISSSLVSAWANAVCMPSTAEISKLSDFFGEDVSIWTNNEIPQMQEIGFLPTEEANPSAPLIITADETVLIQRVRRMSQDERDALYTLLHVFR